MIIMRITKLIIYTFREVRRSGEAAGRGPPQERGEAEREQEDLIRA